MQIEGVILMYATKHFENSSYTCHKKFLKVFKCTVISFFMTRIETPQCHAGVNIKRGYHKYFATTLRNNWPYELRILILRTGILEKKYDTAPLYYFYVLNTSSMFPLLMTASFSIL